MIKSDSTFLKVSSESRETREFMCGKARWSSSQEINVRNLKSFATKPRRALTNDSSHQEPP